MMQGSDTRAAAEPSVKGWCPGALRPMASGDGLVVRVRARSGALPLAGLAALADAATRFGNGHIDVTRRANLQLRGVSEATLPALLDELRRLGLLDASPDAEAVRNIMVAPLSGLDPTAADVRGIVRGLELLLAGDPRLHALPGKFGYVVCGGGTLPVAGEEADIAVAAAPGAGTASIGIARAARWHWLGRVPLAVAAEAVRVVALAFQHGREPHERGRLRNAPPDVVQRIEAALAHLVMPMIAAPVVQQLGARIGALRLGPDTHVVGVGAPFGRLEAAQLRRLVAGLEAGGASEVRLSPWRVLYAAVRDATAASDVLAAAADAGFITEAADPLSRLEACPGKPDCPSASLDTRGPARLVASALPGSGFTGTVHVSGCRKGCARSQPAALTLVADGAVYRVIRDGTAADEPCATLSPQELAAAPARVLRPFLAPTRHEPAA